MDRYDAIVLGLGAMGCATAWQLARRGARVLGLDRHAPPHELGSSHGETRITRLAIGEGDHLTPLALRAREIWREIERETGTSLLQENGGLILSSSAKTSFTHVEGFFDNTVRAAEKFGIAHERLDANQIRARFPRFRVRDNEIGYFEPAAGYLKPEACIAAQLDLAKRAAADLRTDETVLGFEENAGGVTVTTDRGRYVADRLVVTAGAWLPKLLDDAHAKLFRIYRQVQHWFEILEAPENFAPERFPIFIWELQDSEQGIYGFPALGGAAGLKIATESYDASTSPETVERSVSQSEIETMYRRFVAPYISGLGPRAVASTACLYTATPDFGFVLDWLPGSQRVLIGSACSGHGFKHSPTVGEILAELVTSGRSRFDMRPFQFVRFGQ